jgi:hypothetical protein
VEEDLGGTSVSEVFKLYGEGFFREKEVSYYSLSLSLSLSLILPFQIIIIFLLFFFSFVIRIRVYNFIFDL